MTVMETLTPSQMHFLVLRELPISMISGVAVLNTDVLEVDENGIPTWYLTHEQMDAKKVNKLAENVHFCQS